MLKHRILALAATALLALGTSAQADLLDDIKAAGVIRIATPQDSPPFGVPGPDMKIVGYDIDMAQLIAEKLGVELEMVPTTTPARMPALQTGRADIIVSSLGKTPEREEVVDFSIAYAPFFLAIYSAEGVEINDPEDLAWKRIGVTRGAIDDLEATRIAPETAEMMRFEDQNGQLSAYLSGQIDIIASNNVAAAAISRQMPARAPHARIMLRDSPCYIGIPKGETALVEAIDKIIQDAKADGTLNRLSQTWFHEDLPADF